MKNEKKHTRILILILFCAFILRIFQLGKVPISLHGDEVGVGFNAYSLLTAGVDEYGRRLPLDFRADIPPLNFYLTAGLMALLGKTEVAIRLPSVIYGTVTVILVYYLVRRLFDQTTALLSSLFLAVSPWHVQVSRIAHEANLGVMLQVAGSLLFVEGMRKPKKLLASALLFGLSLYAYHGPRLTTPLLIGSLLLLYRNKLALKPLRQWLIQAGLLLLLFVLPLGGLILSRPLTENRLAGISILIRDVTLKLSREEAGRTSTLAQGLFHNPLMVYLLATGRQYFEYLDWNWLFFDTSSLRYFNVSRVGLVYVWDLPFLLAGIYFLVKRSRGDQKLPLLWLLIAPLPGAITLGTPNPGRSLMLLPMLQVVTAVGLGQLYRKTQARLSGAIWRLVVGFITLAFVFNVSFFLHQYLVQTPYEFAEQWDYGMKEAVEVTRAWEDEVDTIVFTTAFKQPYIFVLFYGDKTYEWIRRVGAERHHFIGYKALGKYKFRTIDWENDRNLSQALIVGTAKEIPENVPGIIREIYDLDQNVVLRIVRI